MAGQVPVGVQGDDTVEREIEDADVAKALRAGASGFLGKGVSPDVLLSSIRTVAAGDSFLSPAARSNLLADSCDLLGKVVTTLTKPENARLAVGDSTDA